MVHWVRLAALIALLPLRAVACEEPEGFMTFRLGLFGLDKLYDGDGTMARLKTVLDKVL